MLILYRKILKISPGAYIFQRPFLRAYFWRSTLARFLKIHCYVECLSAAVYSLKGFCIYALKGNRAYFLYGIGSVSAGRVRCHELAAA